MDSLQTAQAGGIRRIGKYDITAVLGRGGMGVVYRALDAALGRVVAIKTLTGGFSGDPSMLKRFYEEGRSMARLNHPGIVTVYDLGDADGMPYIVMEFLSGVPLDKRLAGEPMVLADRLRIVEDVCSALGYAHQRGVIHRDVKPANIFVQPDGRAKLLDFGIARLAERDSFDTREGLILGTVTYMAPERVRAEEIDGRSDIFAAGVVLYQLITGELPFTGSDYELLQQILHKEPAPLNSKGIQSSDALQAIVDRALAKSLDKRYATAEQMGADLAAVIADLTRRQISDLLSEAQRFMESKDFLPAHMLLLQALKIDGKHVEARKLLAESEEHVTQEQRTDRVQQIREKASAALKHNEFDRCLMVLEEGLQLDPADIELSVLWQKAKSAKEEKTRKVPAARVAVEESVGVTELRAIPAPTGFLQETVFTRTRFFEGDQVRYSKIQETLKFYRDHLNREYQSLSDQAKLTYYLWIVSVVLGLGALVSGVVLLFLKQYAAGSISTISTAFVYFIQKVFQQREDHYRSLASAKQGVLEYGNHWLLVIQSIDSIGNAAERERRESELVDVLTRRLDASQVDKNQPNRSAMTRRKKAPAGVAQE